jgi:hypothetical protein
MTIGPASNFSRSSMASPRAVSIALVFDTDGNMYGTTVEGGEEQVSLQNILLRASPAT